MNATKNKVLNSSQTEEKASDLADLTMFRRFLSNARNGEITRSITNFIGDMAENAFHINKKDATALGKM